MVDNRFSTKNLDRNSLLQRQRSIARINQQELMQQSIQNNQNQSPSRQQLINEAVNGLLSKGKANDAFKSLTKKEQSQAQDLANELERTGAIIGANQLVSNIEEQASQSITPQIKKQLVKDILRTGQATYYQKQGYQNELNYSPTPQINQRQQQDVGLVETRPKFFKERAKEIIKSPVERTQSGATNIPAQVRKVIPLAKLGFETGVAKLEQKAKEFGFGEDAPLFKKFDPTVKSFGKSYTFDPGEFVGNLILGALFEPAINTGSAQQLESEYIYDYVSQRFIKKSEVGKLVQERLGESLRGSAKQKELGIEVKGGNVLTEGELREATRRLINKNVDNLQILKKLNKFYQQNGRLDLFKDIAEQEGIVFSKARSPTPIKINQIAQANIKGVSGALGTLGKQSITQRIESLPKMVGGQSKFTSTYQGLGLYEKTNEVGYKKLSKFQIRQNIINNNLKEQYNLQRNLRLNGSSIKEIQSALNNLRIKQKQDLSKLSNQSQPSRFGQSSGQGLGLSSAQSSAQRSQQRQSSALKYKSSFKGRNGFRPSSPQIPKPKITTIPSISSGNKIKTLISNSIPKKFDVFAKRSGKLIRINPKPFGSKSEATDFLAKRLDVTLRASGIIKSSFRKGISAPQSNLMGYFMKNKSKFYFNKKTGFLVERRSFRLEKGGTETKEIKGFKRRIKPFSKRL